MNAQERRLALLSLLSEKATSDSVKIVASFNTVGAKTKTMAGFLTTIAAKKPLLAITREERDDVLGGNNLAEVRVINVEYLNPHDLLKYQDLVFTEASLKHLYSHFSK